LLEGSRRNSQADGRVSPTQLLNGLNRILLFGVDGVVGPKLPGQLQLLVNQVDCDNGSPSNLGILQGHMSQSPDAKDSHQVGGTGPADLYRLVGCDARACQGSSLQGIYLCRYFGDISGEGWSIFSVGSRDKIAGIELLQAQGLPSRDTVLAGATGITQPGDGHPVSLFDLRHSCSHALNEPHAFMTRNEGKSGLDRPISMRGVNIRMAQSRGFNFDDDLPRCRFRLGDFFQTERGSELMYDGCFHCLFPSLFFVSKTLNRPMAHQWFFNEKTHHYIVVGDTK